jgi:hypothetical protein
VEAASFATMSANDNKIVPSDQGRSPVGSEGGETRVATRAYAVRQRDTTLSLMHLSAERGLDYDEVRQLNPAVATRNGLLKAGDVLKLPKEKGSSAAKRAADAVDDTTTASEPSTAPPATADDTNAPVVGEDITPADAPRGDSRDAPADDTTGPVHPGTARASHDGDDDAGSTTEQRGSSRTPPPPSSTPGMPPASPDDRADPSLDEVREDMRRRGVSAVRGIGGVVGAVVKTAGASVGAVREAAAASSAVLRESSEDLRRTSDWVNSEVTGIATKAGEEIENLRRSRPAGTKDSSLDSSDSPDADASDSLDAVSKTPSAVSTTPPTPPSSPARRTLAERVEARAERRRAAEAESSARREKSKSVAEAVRGKLTEAGQLVHKMRQDEGTAPVHDDAKTIDANRKEKEEEAARARLAEATAKRRAEAQAREAAREAERAKRREQRDRLRVKQDEERRDSAAASAAASAKLASKPAATAAKPAPKPTKRNDTEARADIKAKVEADRLKAEREREARRRDFEARRKAREERRGAKKNDASKPKPTESKPAFELPFTVKKTPADQDQKDRAGSPDSEPPAARIRALVDRARERPEETARVFALAAAGAAAGAVAGKLTRLGLLAAVGGVTRRLFENKAIAAAGGIFWDGAGITAATRAKHELARIKAGGPDADLPTFAESCRDARDARRLDLPARVGPAIGFGRFLPGGGVFACLKLVLFGIAAEDRTAASSAAAAAPAASPEDQGGVAAVAALAAAEAAVALAEAAAERTPETTPAKISRLSPVQPSSPVTPVLSNVPVTPATATPGTDPRADSTPGTPPPRSAYPAKTPGKTRGELNDDDETDPLSPRTLDAIGMSGASTPPPTPGPAAGTRTPMLSPRRLPGEHAGRDEYRTTELKLEGRRDALMQRYVSMEAAEGRTVDPDAIVPPSPAPSQRWLTKTSPSASPSRGRVGVPRLDLSGVAGGQNDESARDVSPTRAAMLEDRPVANGLKIFEDERAGDDELRFRVERLDRECAVLEGRLAFREDQKTRELRVMKEKEAADAARRVKKSIWHFATSVKRRALLAWVLELDEATRRKRLLRKALARMKMRTLSDSFEGWVEFRRKAKEQRLERKVAELERRAAAAEAAEAEAQREGEAARKDAQEKAATLAEAEAREAEARREVDEIRGEGAEPWSPSSVVSLTPGPTPRTPRNIDDTVEEKIVEDGPGEAAAASEETPLPP